MPAEVIFSIEVEPEGGYVAQALGHAIVTQGNSMEDLRRMIQAGVRCHFDAEGMPRVIRLRQQP